MERRLTPKEREKRGCSYCLDTGNKEQVRHCPHDKCPYNVLDKYETYEDYMKSEDSKIDITALFDTECSAGLLARLPSDRLKTLRRVGKGSLF